MAELYMAGLYVAELTNVQATVDAPTLRVSHVTPTIWKVGVIRIDVLTDES